MPHPCTFQWWKPHFDIQIIYMIIRVLDRVEKIDGFCAKTDIYGQKHLFSKRTLGIVFAIEL